MPKTTVYQLRLTPEEKAELAYCASMNGGSIAKLIRDTFGLGNHSRRQAPERVMVKPRYEGGQVLDVTPAEIAEATHSASEIKRLLMQLKNQGYTTPVAERMARERLGVESGP